MTIDNEAQQMPDEIWANVNSREGSYWADTKPLLAERTGAARDGSACLDAQRPPPRHGRLPAQSGRPDRVQMLRVIAGQMLP